METQFMGETMTTTHMIERDPVLYHEIWHAAWREAWETSIDELLEAMVDLTYFAEDVIGFSPMIEKEKAKI